MVVFTVLHRMKEIVSGLLEGVLKIRCPHLSKIMGGGTLFFLNPMMKNEDWFKKRFLKARLFPDPTLICNFF